MDREREEGAGRGRCSRSHREGFAGFPGDLGTTAGVWGVTCSDLAPSHRGYLRKLENRTPSLRYFHLSKKLASDSGPLAGSVGGGWDSRFWGSGFGPHVGVVNTSKKVL